MTRPTWPETWMAIARTIAERSYDPRLKVGAIVVSSDNTQMLAGGYNGNYAGGPHEHESPEPGMSGFIHAEVNALIKLDFNFPKAKHMYVTHSPCRMCAKLIINTGIEKVVYGEAYRDPSGIDLLTKAGVVAVPIDLAVRIRQRAEQLDALEHTIDHLVRCAGHYGDERASTDPACGWQGSRSDLVNGCCPVCRAGHIMVVL